MTQKPEAERNERRSALLEELAEAVDLSPMETSADGKPGGKSPRDLARLQDIIANTDNPNIAIVILGPELDIVHATPAARLLFSDYHAIDPKPFFNVFQQCLDHDETQDLVVSLRTRDKGYSWSGTMRHKTGSTKTLYTSTTFIPFFDAKKKVSGFLVYFYDITAGFNDQLHSTFRGILEAAKLKDNETGLHNDRVGFYSKKLAEYLYENRAYPQIDPDFIDNIRFLAAMHDVGKIGTPDYILQKPGKLTDLEWEIMREHTINGTFILSSYPVPMAKEIALSHHEWWDGTGYPFKIDGNMIPLPARIVAIADVYDALRMKRTYKSEYTHEESIAQIFANSGTQFDPRLIEAFRRIHQEFDDIWNLLRDPERGEGGPSYERETGDDWA